MDKVSNADGLKTETIKLPAEDVVSTLLSTLRMICECDSEVLEDLIIQYYPLKGGGVEVVDAVFLPDTDEVELVYVPEGDEWDELDDDMFEDDEMDEELEMLIDKIYNKKEENNEHL